ncbi:MAG: NAD(P)/FAD-dependent oxidoreductase [Verrucomicrobia bacterium]|nr:NAD(P)/FAD-dependent oxidoreductase [Verrucomicrobiota bacterium]
MSHSYDVVILGAGHNGLVAAAYLARAGLRVLVLEKNDYLGGATASQRVFPDYDARLSRYAYLVSLLPEKIIRDLDLHIDLRRRATGSFTPYERDGRHDGLLLSNVSPEASRRSLTDLTGSAAAYDQLQRFYDLARVFAEQTWDTLLEPLPSRAVVQRRFEQDDLHREAWRSLVEEPLGVAIERHLDDDLLRGVVFTDGKIGVFTHPHDPSLLQNRCFLYHLIGNRTGEWKVPAGGMGHVAGEFERAARAAGAELRSDITLAALDVSGARKSVQFTGPAGRETVEADFVLVNFGPNVLAKYLPRPFIPDPTDEGSVFKINMLLRRLPRLKASHYPASEAFCGTFHCDEGYEEMKLSHAQAAAGRLPDRVPCEVYCHTLTDGSILSRELIEQGYHTMTLFGLDTPWSLFERDNTAQRVRAQRKFLAGMNRWLEEPLEECLAVAADGSLCIESKTPEDLDASLGLYHGNIFQTALTFPFADEPELVGTWGVGTGFERVYFCGSAAQRGGAVSGVPGHNAARQVLADLGRA